MAEVVLFHHAQGLTEGVVGFAAELRAAGHVVHTPDLYDGNTFTDLSDGMAYAKQVGTETIADNAASFADDLPHEVVYGGFSLGGMSAQKLAQTRPGAKGCLLLHTAIPLGYFGDEWPRDLPLQIHTSEADDYGDADVAKELAEKIDSAEVFSTRPQHTCSRTRASPTTTRVPQRWSKNEC